jgi:dUTP pyrophosphatase
MRKFEVVTGFNCVQLPKRSTRHSAGYDFIALGNVVIRAKSMVVINTGVKVCIPEDEVLQIYPRSSFGFKRQLMLANSTGIIDSDYYNNPDNEGHIMIAYYNYGEDDQVIKAGEKIAQGIFHKYFVTDDDYVDTIRKGGLGSTNA